MAKLGDPEYLYLVKQGSDEWLKKRLGIITASKLDVIITKTGKPAKNETMRAYANQIVAEREYSFLEDNYQSFDMMRGHYQEEIARDIYSDTYEEVYECGIITRTINGITVGASPDGLVGKDGGIEIKSRVAKFQVKTIVAGEVPPEYMLQVQFCLLVSGRKWWDFVQYSNGLPLFVKRVKPDLDLQEKIIDAIIQFESEVEKIRADYKEKASKLVPTKRMKLEYDEGVITVG